MRTSNPNILRIFFILILSDTTWCSCDGDFEDGNNGWRASGDAWSWSTKTAPDPTRLVNFDTDDGYVWTQSNVRLSDHTNEIRSPAIKIKALVRPEFHIQYWYEVDQVSTATGMTIYSKVLGRSGAYVKIKTVQKTVNRWTNLTFTCFDHWRGCCNGLPPCDIVITIVGSIGDRNGIVAINYFNTNSNCAFSTNVTSLGTYPTTSNSLTTTSDGGKTSNGNGEQSTTTNIATTNTNLTVTSLILSTEIIPNHTTRTSTAITAVQSTSTTSYVITSTRDANCVDSGSPRAQIVFIFLGALCLIIILFIITILLLIYRKRATLREASHLKRYPSRTSSSYIKEDEGNSVQMTSTYEISH